VPKISFRNVKKVYPSGTYALDGINFDIEQGDFVCIIGESGGGKTTLLKLISGLEKATSGEIYFDDEISNYVKVAKRNVAFVFQDYTIYPNMTVFENIILALKSYKLSYEEKAELAWDIIQKMDLTMIQGELPKVLSFGQCQKVALAKALVRKPQMILFDEPLSNIDILAKNEYKNIILEAKKILPDCTFLYVTHNISDAMQLSNKIMVIDKGKLLQFDYKQTVFEFPNSSIVADYILDGANISKGFIENDMFISNDLKIYFNKLQQLTLDNNKIDNVTCYSLGNIHSFFDVYGNAVTGIKSKIFTDLVIEEENIILLGKRFAIKELKEAIISKGNMTAIINPYHFSFEKKDKDLEFNGYIEYSYLDYVVVKIDNKSIICKNTKNYIEGEEVLIYYPIDFLKAIDNNGNTCISSYIISRNIVNCKVINSKKGIINFLGKRIYKEEFIDLDKKIEVSIPLDAFLFHEEGKYTCDILYNEENLGSKTLIHFSCKKISSYLSAIVDNPFLGFNLKKIKFDINFEKLVLYEE